jgi:hypothetical protein
MRLLVIPLVFSFALADSPTTDIKVNQAGYLTDASKLAMVVPESTASEFVVRAADGSVAFSGSLSSAVEGADSGDRVRRADFSALKTPGRYFLEIPDVGRSWDFKIGPDVYSRVFRSRQDPAMRLLPELPPAKMYVDDQESYASNENAINWNAPLVFLLAGTLE